MARKFNGELVSADSRQVFTGFNIIHGKDLPPNSVAQDSDIVWQSRRLKYYELDAIKVWLYDIVDPSESFSISLWRQCADLVISDIHRRGKLPIVVGGSGLYIKTLTHRLTRMSIPPNPTLRSFLAEKTPGELWDYLFRLDSGRAASLNRSDRHNPHRLIRAIEIAQSPSGVQDEPTNHEILLVGLTAGHKYLYSLVDSRVDQRIVNGAAAEDPDLAAQPERWKAYEHKIVRRQLTWFKKQPGVHWFDISQIHWRIEAEILVKTWYNSAN